MMIGWYDPDPRRTARRLRYLMVAIICTAAAAGAALFSAVAYLMGWF